MYSNYIMIGRLRLDPELNYTKKKVPVTRLQILEDCHRNDIWHSITVWGDLAERACKLFKEGSVGFFRFRLNYETVCIQRKDKTTYYAKHPNFIAVQFKLLCPDQSEMQSEEDPEIPPALTIPAPGQNSGRPTGSLRSGPASTLNQNPALLPQPRPRKLS